jgi:pimeloyl-ACP methyl ester carboxylesterase
LSAAPHLVLLPGLDGTGELFAPLLQALGEDITTSVVRYGAELTFDEYVESAGKALPEQCVLIAESFSGPVAIAVAARHPGKIRCLVLCATFAVSPFRTLLSGVRFVPKRMFRPSLLLPTMVDHFCFSGASISVRPSPVAVVSTVPPAIMRARLACLGKIDVRPAPTDHHADALPSCVNRQDRQLTTQSRADIATAQRHRHGNQRSASAVAVAAARMRGRDRYLHSR